MGKKKTQKMRGSKTHGYGAKKKHRGAGSRGGRGYAGSFKHKRIGLRKKEPERFAKRKFKSLRQIGRKKKPRAINLRDLERLAGKEKEVDLKKLGYGKILASGEIKKALVIKNAAASKRAAEKIEKAGGKIVND